ncbi:hypothetical protein LINPERHAP1_LOCUS11844 [Linum perenne]
MDVGSSCLSNESSGISTSVNQTYLREDKQFLIIMDHPGAVPITTAQD